MALSGVFQGVYRGYTFRSTWSAVQDIANNKSIITVNHDLVCASGYDLYVSSKTGNYCTVDGVKVNFTSPKISTKGNQSIRLNTTTHTVYHNTDGTKSVSFSAGFNINIGSMWIYSNGTIDLDTIPRASNFTLSSSSIKMNGTSQLVTTINRATSSFTHKITYQCGDYKSEFSGVDTSHSFTVPKEWNNAVTSSVKGTATITVATYSGNTLIGSPQAKSFEVIVPDDIVPNISSFTTTRNNNNIVPADWAIYVQGKSKVDLSINSPSGSYSSRIVDYKITGAGFSFTGQTATSDTIEQSGTVTFTATVTDSRGRQATRQASIYVQPYSMPKINDSTKCYRSNSEGLADDNGEFVAVFPDVTFSSVSGKNSLIIKANNVAISNQKKYIIPNVSTDTTFTITLILTDAFSTTQQVYTIPTAIVAMDFHHSGLGVAIGKVAETSKLFEVDMDAQINGALNVDMDMKINGNVYINDKTIFDYIYPVGSIYMSVNAVNPSTLFGGVWERWGKGRTVVSIDENDDSFKTVEKQGGNKAQELYAQVSVVSSSGQTIVNTTTLESVWEANYHATGTVGSNSTRTNWGTVVTDKYRNNPSSLQPYITCYMWKRTD